MTATADPMPEDWPAQFDGKTKAEIIGLLYEQFQSTAAVAVDRDAWRASKLPVGEAQAIAGCVRALDALKADRSASASSVPDAAVERVLDFLRARYLGPQTRPVEEIPVIPARMFGQAVEDFRDGDTVCLDTNSGYVTRVIQQQLPYFGDTRR